MSKTRFKLAVGMLLGAAALSATGPWPQAMEGNPPAEQTSNQAGDSKLAEEFERLHGLIKPQVGESKWAAIPWMTNLMKARQRAVTEDKPLFVWRAGGGEVLGRA